MFAIQGVDTFQGVQRVMYSGGRERVHEQMG